MAKKQTGPMAAPAVVIEVPNGAPVQGDEPLEEFTGFEEPTPHDTPGALPVDMDLQERHKEDMREVAILPRQTLMRVRIGNREDGSPAWYNFIKGKEVLVPKHVADWLHEQNVL